MKKVIYYVEKEKKYVLKSDKYDSLVFDRISKDILEKYYMNDLEYYLLANGYSNFILEEE